jgi:hypothetical protein
MQSFLRPSRRAAIVGGAAGLALVGAVGIGTVAFADSAPTPGATQSPSASGAPAAPGTPGPRAHAPHIGGTVLTVDGSTVTVRDRDGFTRTIRLGDGATVTKDDASSSASAITKGVWIEASGTVDADGTTLDATEVRIGQPAGPRGGHGGPGGRPGDHGARPAAPEGAPAAPEGAPAAPAAPATPGATPSGTPSAS